MKIQKSAMKCRNARIKADTEVAEEAVDLLFETNDVAELIAEVTNEDVDVTADGEIVEFSVGDETYTCSAEPGDEIVESSTRVRTKRRVSASTGCRPVGRTVRKLPRRK